MVTFDTASDRNAGRERIGIGVLMGRWLKLHLRNTTRTLARS